MHIVFLSPSWPIGYPNGIVTYVHNLRLGLRAAGHRVSVLTLGGETDDLDEVYLVRPSWTTKVKFLARRLFGSDSSLNLLIPRAVVDSVLRLHKRSPVDVMEMEESFGWCGQVQRGVPFPLVIKLHGPAFLTLLEEDLNVPFNQEKIEHERLALRSARFVTSPSRYTLDRAREFTGRQTSWGKVIVNPVVFDDSVPLWSRTRADSNTLLFVGRFDKLKGGDIVIQAFAKLLDQRPNLRLIFVGPDRGVQFESGGRVSIDEFARDRLPDWKFERLQITGAISLDQVARLRTEAAITLICSRFDNQPNTVLEALFQRCPVVGIGSGGVSEVIDDGVTGVLARNGDLEDFCAKVLWLLDNPLLGEAYGLAGRQYVLTAHSVSSVASQSSLYYSNACERFRTGGKSE